MTAPGTIHELVAGADAGRVDRYLAGGDLPVSRAQVRRLIDAGAVTVNGHPVKASYTLHSGDRIRVCVPQPQPTHLVPQDLPVALLFEDPWIAVVAKPRGLVVHPAPGHPTGTLVNALLHRCRDLSGIGGVLRPGLVHRLDKDTSGLLVVAKDDATHRSLQEQFKGRSVRKVYLAVVLGRLEGRGVADRPIGRHPRDRKKMAVDAPRAKPALTHWQCLQSLAAATLLEVTIETGRTHQIRVHLAALGHPVAGDAVYGGTARARGIADPEARRVLATAAPHALHAWRLGFRHPRSGLPLAFEAPLPPDLADLIRALGGQPPGAGAGHP